jgi:hypothetical protein
LRALNRRTEREPITANPKRLRTTWSRLPAATPAALQRPARREDRRLLFRVTA